MDIQCPHDLICPKKQLNIPCRIETRFRPLQIFDFQRVKTFYFQDESFNYFDYFSISKYLPTLQLKCHTLLLEKLNEIKMVKKRMKNLITSMCILQRYLWKMATRY